MYGVYGVFTVYGINDTPPMCEQEEVLGVVFAAIIGWYFEKSDCICY